MPELPEVETTCRGIRPLIAGRVATGCSIRNGRLRLPVPADLGGHIIGHRLLDVRRRAKYLLLTFAHGGVIMHLGMSGSLRVLAADVPFGPHDHVDLHFGEQILRLRDPRRFGLVVWHGGDDVLAHPLLARLGPEPLDDSFDGKWLFSATRGARLPVKQALMDAQRVVGVGNIYASECLFRARINPMTAAGGIGKCRYQRLVAALRETLDAAIQAGGSTLRDFVGGDGRAGYFQQQYFVYGRAGLPCRVCGRAVQRAVIGQRSTFWCAQCQRR
jgi:formamidopyrimidine-DNA glycosylase